MSTTLKFELGMASLDNKEPCDQVVVEPAVTSSTRESSPAGLEQQPALRETGDTQPEPSPESENVITLAASTSPNHPGTTPKCSTRQQNARVRAIATPTPTREMDLQDRRRVTKRTAIAAALPETPTTAGDNDSDQENRDPRESATQSRSSRRRPPPRNPMNGGSVGRLSFHFQADPSSPSPTHVTGTWIAGERRVLSDLPPWSAVIPAAAIVDVRRRDLSKPPLAATSRPTEPLDSPAIPPTP
ncbi:hypothetical protein BC828DRAFT_126246 [Blastocladiella britannica]|nr:hypothetical protein BC828DRAFT_126246 [Blastocladiella britannica]